MIFGDKNRIAIEVNIHSYYDGFIFGQFRMWVQRNSIGDFEDTVAIQGCANWLEHFLLFSGRRTLPKHENLSSDKLIRILLDHINTGCSDGKNNSWRDKFLLNDIGMSAFNDINIILIERTNGDEQIVWSDKELKLIHDAILPSGIFAKVSINFLNWLYETSEWREYQQWRSRR